MRFWWVNHSQTVQQEVDGGYIWSPRRERNGSRSQFYDNLLECQPEDYIISFAKQHIRYLGKISGQSVHAPKPIEFGISGENWDETGWLVPVSWVDVKSPFRPKDFIRDIALHLPKKYSPIQANGNGNQKAYLTEIDKTIFEWAAARSDTDLASIDGLKNSPLIGNSLDIVDQKIEEFLNRRLDIGETEKIELGKSRRGQGIFRDRVMQIENCCRVTGIFDKEILIASHIKPWRSCKTSGERLDGNNGLMLTPTIDKLFDVGLITFLENGLLKKSKYLSDRSAIALGLEKALSIGVGGFNERQRHFLHYHNAQVFRGEV